MKENHRRDRLDYITIQSFECRNKKQQQNKTEKYPTQKGNKSQGKMPSARIGQHNKRLLFFFLTEFAQDENANR